MHCSRKQLYKFIATMAYQINIKFDFLNMFYILFGYRRVSPFSDSKIIKLLQICTKI